MKTLIASSAPRSAPIEMEWPQGNQEIGALGDQHRSAQSASSAVNSSLSPGRCRRLLVRVPAGRSNADDAEAADYRRSYEVVVPPGAASARLTHPYDDRDRVGPALACTLDEILQRSLGDKGTEHKKRVVVGFSVGSVDSVAILGGAEGPHPPSLKFPEEPKRRFQAGPDRWAEAVSPHSLIDAP